MNEYNFNFPGEKFPRSIVNPLNIVSIKMIRGRRYGVHPLFNKVRKPGFFENSEYKNRWQKMNFMIMHWDSANVTVTLSNGSTYSVTCKSNRLAEEYLKKCQVEYDRCMKLFAQLNG